MSKKRLVLFVEGKADEAAVAALVKKRLTEQNAWEYLSLDDNAFRVGDVVNLTGRNIHNWDRWLKAAAHRKNLGAVLLVLDGDRKFVLNDDTHETEAFCAADVARRLAKRARDAGAGSGFSVACVFARQEFESWLLAGVDSLRGNPLPDGRRGVRSDAPAAERDTDEHPRDAKKWFRKHLHGGYKPTVDQEPLAKLVTLESIRQSSPRSFVRFEHALEELCEAIASGAHIVSPAER